MDRMPYTEQIVERERNENGANIEVCLHEHDTVCTSRWFENTWYKPELAHRWFAIIRVTTRSMYNAIVLHRNTNRIEEIEAQT